MKKTSNFACPTTVQKRSEHRLLLRYHHRYYCFFSISKPHPITSFLGLLFEIIIFYPNSGPRKLDDMSKSTRGAGPLRVRARLTMGVCGAMTDALDTTPHSVVAVADVAVCCCSRTTVPDTENLFEWNLEASFDSLVDLKAKRIIVLPKTLHSDFLAHNPYYTLNTKAQHPDLQPFFITDSSLVCIVCYIHRCLRRRARYICGERSDRPIE